MYWDLKVRILTQSREIFIESTDYTKKNNILTNEKIPFWEEQNA